MTIISDPLRNPHATGGQLPRRALFGAAAAAVRWAMWVSTAPVVWKSWVLGVVDGES